MAQSPTVELPKRLPLVTQPENRDETTLKDAKLVNGYAELNPQTGEYWIFKRPGLLQTETTRAGNGYGVYNWRGNIYKIHGATMYKDDVALSGTLDVTNGVYQFSSCLGATPKMQFGNGVKAYNYDASAGIVEITGGANWPTTQRKGWAYLNGTTYVMNASANILGCAALNSPGTWTDVLNTITAQIEPDGGVALTKQLVYVVALKEWTTEIFYDRRNATGSPLGPMEGAKINYGCASQDSLQVLDGVLFWIATNRSSAAQVIMVDNLKPKIVSTKAIERLLEEGDFTAVFSFSVKVSGHRFYAFTLKNNNLTLVYDATDDMWMQWTDVDGNYFPIVAATYNSTQGRILQHETNGKLYLLDATYLNDDGSIITVDLYTPNFDGGTRRVKHMKALKFIGDQTVGSILQVRVNDHDYDAAKWTNFRKVDMSKKTAMLTDCGSFINRAHNLRHQSNTRMRLKAVDMQIDLGTL